MVFGSFKNLFGQNKTADRSVGPLGLRIGAAVELDTLRFRMMAEQLKFDLSGDTLFVTASGRVDLGDGSIVLRYYTDQHTMFQILCVGGETDAHIQEVTLYAPYTSFYPEGAEWSEWEGDGGKIGQTAYRLDDGTIYDRIWFKEDPDWSSPVRFEERVVDEDNAASLIGQEVMLFGRQIPGDPGYGEYLLLAIESRDDGRSVEVMLGVDLDRGMFKII
jgi:hypothetical protein